MLIPSIDLLGGQIVQLVQGEKLKLAFDDFDYWIDRFSKYSLVQLIDLDAAMRQVDDHADLIHALDDADAELGEAGLGRLEGAAANQVPEVVRQLRFALTQSVEQIDIVRRAEML